MMMIRYLLSFALLSVFASQALAGHAGHAGHAAVSTPDVKKAKKVKSPPFDYFPADDSRPAGGSRAKKVDMKAIHQMITKSYDKNSAKSSSEVNINKRKLMALASVEYGHAIKSYGGYGHGGYGGYGGYDMSGSGSGSGSSSGSGSHKKKYKYKSGSGSGSGSGSDKKKKKYKYKKGSGSSSGSGSGSGSGSNKKKDKYKYKYSYKGKGDKYGKYDMVYHQETSDIGFSAKDDFCPIYGPNDMYSPEAQFHGPLAPRHQAHTPYLAIAFSGNAKNAYTATADRPWEAQYSALKKCYHDSRWVCKTNRVVQCGQCVAIAQAGDESKKLVMSIRDIDADARCAALARCKLRFGCECSVIFYDCIFDEH